MFGSKKKKRSARPAPSLAGESLEKREYFAVNPFDAAFDVPELEVANFAEYAGGWNTQKHPRMMADVNGDNRDDIVGFGNSGVIVSFATAETRRFRFRIASQRYDF